MGKTLHAERLIGLHPSLATTVTAAATSLPFDVMVVEGLRSDKQALINYGKGRTAAQLAAKGVPTAYAQPGLAKVTWLSNPLSTKHRRQSDGFGHAVDLLPAPFDWKDPKLFDAVATAMFAAAHALGVVIRWGADWDSDGNPRERGETDSPHFEI